MSAREAAAIRRLHRPGGQRTNRRVQEPRERRRSLLCLTDSARRTRIEVAAVTGSSSRSKTSSAPRAAAHDQDLLPKICRCLSSDALEPASRGKRDSAAGSVCKFLASARDRTCPNSADRKRPGRLGRERTEDGHRSALGAQRTSASSPGRSRDAGSGTTKAVAGSGGRTPESGRERR
jgi:hypothetical protein